MESDKKRSCELVTRYLSFWEQADIEGIMSMYAPAMQYHDMPSGEVIAYQDLQNYLSNTFFFEKETRLTLKDAVYLDDGSAFIYWTQSFYSADQSKTVFINGVELIVFQDEKIISVHEFYDYQGSALEASEPHQDDGLNSKMGKLGLNDDNILKIRQQLLFYYEEKKPYLDPELNLLKVAEQLGYTRNQVSFVINHSLHQTFYDFTNAHRITHMIEQMKAPGDAFSILEMAINSGFNSMSGFYNAFKKQTGMTPAQYRKSL